jgi:hypothetical protein
MLVSFYTSLEVRRNNSLRVFDCLPICSTIYYKVTSFDGLPFVKTELSGGKL